MKFMHTKLPDFISKLKDAATKHLGKTAYSMRGIENLQTAKVQSLRTGRIEEAVEELALEEGVTEVEVVVMPRVPETMHTVVIKSFDQNGNPKKAILEIVNIIHPTEEAEIGDFSEIDDRRPSLGRH